MDMRELRRMIRLTRQNLGLSQQAVAERAGVALQTVNRLESGKRTPPADILLAVLEALGMTLQVKGPTGTMDNLPWFLDPAGDSEAARKLRESPAPLAPPAPVPADDAPVTQAQFKELLAEVARLRREVREQEPS